MKHFPHTLLISLGTLVLLLVPALVSADEVFVPLTSIPGIDAITANSDSLSQFLNTLYRLCVGAAAVIAVIQITRAGIIYMTQDSFHSKTSAKHLIQTSIFGLVLVLAPTIVFSVIDPRILDLKIDASGLRLRDLGALDIGGGGGGNVPQEFRNAAADAMESIMENCGVEVSEEQEACMAENLTGDVAAACNISLTTEQRSCISGEFGECEDLGSIYDGRQVPDDKRQCCVLNNLYAQDLRGGYSVCRSELPQTESGTGQNSNGTYYLNIPTTQGTYGAVRANMDESQECIEVVYGSYQTNEACLSAVSGHEAARGDEWDTLSGCRLENDGVRELGIQANIPWCSSVGSL